MLAQLGRSAGIRRADVEFRGVLEMRLPRAWRGGVRSLTEESDSGAGGCGPEIRPPL